LCAGQFTVEYCEFVKGAVEIVSTRSSDFNPRGVSIRGASGISPSDALQDTIAVEFAIGDVCVNYDRPVVPVPVVLCGNISPVSIIITISRVIMEEE